MLAFAAVVLSAYVRLADTGLGCKDWPGCYAKNALMERQAPGIDAPTRTYTSWQRKLHSQMVMLLGFLSIAICGIAWLKRKELRQSPLLPSLLTGLMAFLALFGILAFSHLPRAIIVPVHLAGGIAMLALLTWILLNQISPDRSVNSSQSREWRIFAWTGFILLAIQLMLGSWVSSNFAAVACTDFPLCKGALLPAMDFSYSLNSSALTEERLTAIHWMHRSGAIIVTVYLGWLAFGIGQLGGMKKVSQSLLILLTLQFGIGAINVLLGLPLFGAVLHNAVAMILVVTLIFLNFKLQDQRT